MEFIKEDRGKEIEIILGSLPDKNARMTQSEVIDYLLLSSERHEKTIERSKIIQEKYDKYFSTKTKESLDDFIVYSMDFFKKFVSNRIYSICMYKEDVEFESTGIIENALIDIIHKLDKDGKYIENIGGYIRTTLYNKISDFVNATKKELETRPYPMQNGQEEDGNSENIEDESDLDILSEDERALAYILARLLKIYCYYMMHIDDHPKRQLALCYARVLSHITSEYDAVATSTIFMLEQIGKKSIFELEKDSENELQHKIDKVLCWGENFKDQVRERENINGRDCVLGTVIYAEVFTNQDIEGWSRGLHNKLVKTIRNDGPRKDKEFFSLVNEYVGVSRVLHFFVETDKEVER